MGKKGSWFTAIKKALTPGSKYRHTNTTVLAQVADKDEKDRRRWTFGGRLRQRELYPLATLRREPSSIEEILQVAEWERRNSTTGRDNTVAALPAPDQQLLLQLPLRPDNHARRSAAEQVAAPHRAYLAIMPRTGILPRDTYISAAVKIQASYRGYTARRNYRILRGLIRLQGVLRGQSVRRQTASTLQTMQVLVRVQRQVHECRVDAMERKQADRRRGIDGGSGRRGVSSNKWLGYEGQDAWNDSVLTKDEMDLRTRRRVEATMKRERALAYAYSHKKGAPATHAIIADVRAGRHPWWWTLTKRSSVAVDAKPLADRPDAFLPRPTSSYSKPTPPPRHHAAAASASLRDDDSLTSCPAFTGVPSYMVPTASAKAKVRAQPRRREEKRRLSFALSHVGSLWNEVTRGGRNAGVAATPRTVVGRHRPSPSAGGLSTDSAVSLPVGFGRTPFSIV